MRPAAAASRALRQAAAKPAASVTDMIGSERDDQRIAVAQAREGGAGADRRAGIATRRLEQDVRLDPDLRQLLGDEKAIIAVGDDDRPAEQRGIGHPLHGFLKGRVRAEQRAETAWVDLRATPATGVFLRRRT